MFNDLIRGALSIDTEKYQGVLNDFSVGVGIYMLPSNLNLNIGKKKDITTKF